MTITVLRPIEPENPFEEIASWLNEDVMPLLILYETNKPKIQRLSDRELSDYVDVLKTTFPQILTQDGKINWDTVEALYQFGSPEEQKVATFLKNAKALREEFANATLYEKLNLLDQVGTATSPDNLRKIITVGKGIKAVKEIIEKSNAPDEVKLWFALNSEVFYEKPEVLKLVLDILTPKKSEETEQETRQETSWKLSLEPYGGLSIPPLTQEKPTPKSPTPTEKPKTTKTTKEKKDGGKKKEEPHPQPQPQLTTFIPNYRPKEPALQTPFLDPIDLLLGGGLGALIGVGVLGRKKISKLLEKIKQRKSKTGQTTQTVSETVEEAPKQVVEGATEQATKQKTRDEERARRLKEVEQRIWQEIKRSRQPSFKMLGTTYEPTKEEVIRRAGDELERIRKSFKQPIALYQPDYGEILSNIPPEVIAKIHSEFIRKSLRDYVKSKKGLPPPSQIPPELYAQIHKEMVENLLKELRRRKKEQSIKALPPPRFGEIVQPKTVPELKAEAYKEAEHLLRSLGNEALLLLMLMRGLK